MTVLLALAWTAGGQNENYPRRTLAVSVPARQLFAVRRLGSVTPSSLHMHPAWQDLLPGFEFGTLTGFLIGLVESYLYGWYIALLFVPLFNFFNRNSSA